MATNKTVLITGASSGFGRLTAKKFQAEGWNVVATMRTPAKETELNQLDSVLVTALDVTNRATIDAAVAQAIERFGAIDVLVNNAGAGSRGYLEQASDREVYDQFDLNVFRPIRTIQAVLPHMRTAGSGTIVNVTSIAAYFGSHLNSLYAAAKSSLHMLSESIAQDLSTFGVDVKVVAPGVIGTGFVEAVNWLEGNVVEEFAPYRPQYESHIEQARSNLANQGGSPSDPQAVADKIFECATSSTPFTNPVGDDAIGLLAARRAHPEDEFLAMVTNLAMPSYSAPTEA